MNNNNTQFTLDSALVYIAMSKEVASALESKGLLSDLVYSTMEDDSTKALQIYEGAKFINAFCNDRMKSDRHHQREMKHQIKSDLINHHFEFFEEEISQSNLEKIISDNETGVIA